MATLISDYIPSWERIGLFKNIKTSDGARMLAGLDRLLDTPGGFIMVDNPRDIVVLPEACQSRRDRILSEESLI